MIARNPHTIAHLGPIIVMAFLLGMAGSARAQEETTPLILSAYREKLQAAAADLRAGTRLARVRADLATPTQVELANGELLPLDLLPGLKTDRETALAQIEMLLDQLERADPTRVEAARAALQQATARLPTTRSSLWDRFWRWLDRLLSDLMPDTLPGAASEPIRWLASGLVWIMVFSGGLLLVVLLSYWLRGLLGTVLAGGNPAGPPSGPEALPATAAEAREEATTLAAAGNYRQAVRRLYLAALLQLKERGLLRIQRHLTNQEVLAQLEQTRLHDTMQPVVETFDRIWYGIQEPDQSQYEAYQTRIDELTRGADRDDHGSH